MIAWQLQLAACLRFSAERGSEVGVELEESGLATAENAAQRSDFGFDGHEEVEWSCSFYR